MSGVILDRISVLKLNKTYTARNEQRPMDKLKTPKRIRIRSELELWLLDQSWDLKQMFGAVKTRGIEIFLFETKKIFYKSEKSSPDVKDAGLDI